MFLNDSCGAVVFVVVSVLTVNLAQLVPPIGRDIQSGKMFGKPNNVR
jgi:hypothetical protein